MYNKILLNYFCKDLVNIIISYLTISEEEVKENYDNLLLELYLFFLYDNMVMNRKISGFHYVFKKKKK
jgi:hypothetical protein